MVDLKGGKLKLKKKSPGVFRGPFVASIWLLS